MSTLKVNDIEEATSGGSKFSLVRVSACVNLVGTATFKSSNGCSTFTDVGTGRVYFNFSNAMPSSGYVGIGCNNYEENAGTANSRHIAGNYSGGNADKDRTTTQFATGAYPDSSYQDRTSIGCMVSG